MVEVSGAPSHGSSKVVVRSLVRTGFERPTAALVRVIAQADVTRPSEMVGRMYSMNGSLRPLGTPALPVAGVVTTAKCPPGDNMGLVKALTMVREGDVLVLDAQAFDHWCLGGFMMAAMRQRAGALRQLPGDDSDGL